MSTTDNDIRMQKNELMHPRGECEGPCHLCEKEMKQTTVDDVHVEKGQTVYGLSPWAEIETLKVENNLETASTDKTQDGFSAYTWHAVEKCYSTFEAAEDAKACKSPNVAMNDYRRAPKNEGGWRSKRWKEFNEQCRILVGYHVSNDDDVADFGGFLLEQIDVLHAQLNSNECNSGHKTLPLKLWNCPACAEEKEKRFKKQIKAGEQLRHVLDTCVEYIKNNVSQTEKYYFPVTDVARIAANRWDKTTKESE